MRKEWRYSQVVRQGSAKPLCPGSNPGGASNVFAPMEIHRGEINKIAVRLLWRNRQTQGT